MQTLQSIANNYYGYYFNIQILTLNHKNVYKLVVCKCYPDYFHANSEENQTSKFQLHFYMWLRKL